MENSVYPDQLASAEASWPGYVLFFKVPLVGFMKAKV